MTFFKTIYSTALDAIFPVSKEEQEALSIQPESAFKTLPRAKNFSTKEACSIFSYADERIRKLVWALKYKKSRQAAAIGGYALFKILRIYSKATRPILVIPMPITKQRRRERGFNQCELLTAEIKRLAHESNRSERIQIVEDLLIRVRHKSRQTMKNRNERIESAHELFKVKGKKDEDKDKGEGEDKGEETRKDCLTIVIDDVITTGSTMKEAIEALRKAGFTRAFGLSLAH